MSTDKHHTQSTERVTSEDAARRQLADDLGYLLARYWHAQEQKKSMRSNTKSHSCQPREADFSSPSG